MATEYNTMMSDLFIALAVWRLTSLFVHENGPFRMFANLREELKEHWYIRSFCFWCLSVWIAFFFAIAFHPDNSWFMWTLGYSAVAIIIEEVISYLQPVIVEQTEPAKEDELRPLP